MFPMTTTHYVYLSRSNIFEREALVDFTKFKTKLKIWKLSL